MTMGGVLGDDGTITWERDAVLEMASTAVGRFIDARNNEGQFIGGPQCPFAEQLDRIRDAPPEGDWRVFESLGSEVTTEEVRRALRRAKNRKAPGITYEHLRLLDQDALVCWVAQCLTDVLRGRFTFPNILKEAHVRLLSKDGVPFPPGLRRVRPMCYKKRCTNSTWVSSTVA